MQSLPILAVVLSVCVATGRAVGGADAASFVIRDVRVFDGERVLERATVAVRDGVINEVRPDAAEERLKPGTTVVEGAGMTLLPGLIDSHMHVAGENPLAQTLAFGVTTALDMFAMPEWIRAMKREDAPDRAELRSSGICATAPGGHGTQFKIEIPTVASPDQAQAFVDARLAEGADYIKIIYGPSIRLATEVMSRETMAALVRAAHACGTLTVVHVHQQHRAAEAIEAGADGLVHVFSDAPPTPALLALAAERKTFVVPTLAVLEGLPRAADGQTPTYAYANAFAAVRALHHAGVPILAGTDAPNPGTAHGSSMHRELELLVAAGLSPVDALRAATSLPARHFRLADRGRIAPGLRADLLLVRGDPTADVTATREIVAVWKGGVRFDRASHGGR